jgi:hypothetical protein
MGWGIGIGIGWPASSGASGPRSGWWEIVDFCGGGFPYPPNFGVFTNFQTDVDWYEGDYVYSPGASLIVKLGPYTATDPGDVIEFPVVGPVVSCS